MDSLFGLSMNAIMIVLLALLGLTIGVLVLVFLRNRIIFMIGLRNIPRRTAQTVLIVVGLMLSTVIITAAFTTGDTVDYSITKQTYDLLGNVDVILDGQTGIGAGSQSGDTQGHSVSGQAYQGFLQAADEAHLPDVDGYAGFVAAPVPAINSRTNLSEPNVLFVGLDETRETPFPDIKDKSSGTVLRVADLAPNEVYLNEEGESKLDARAGDTLKVYTNGQEHVLTVKAIVKNAGITGAINGQAKEGMVASLTTVQGLVGTSRLDAIVISGNGGIRDVSLSVNIEKEVQDLIVENHLALAVSDTKHGLVHDAETFGNVFTTIFLVLGLFSIGSGILLIVMIFVMLSAERKSEMGMARAIGTKRRHLVEMFLAEGMGYNLMSAFVGVAFGVLVAFALTTAATLLFSSVGLSFTPHATARTLAISFSLGVVLTFFTVAFSSWRVSNLNIVRAIRDVPEPTNKRMGWKGLAFWVVAIIFGILNFSAGLSSGQAFPFALGFSLVLMGIAVLATHFGAPARPSYTISSLFLLLFWGLTAGERLNSIFGQLSGGPEMFFLSGTAMVTASTFVIIYNSDLLLAFLSRAGGAFGSILPAIRTAIAYPMANRVRTGMTLSMISLVVFALTMMSAMNLNYDKLFLADSSRGGWDVQVAENRSNPINSVKGVLTQAGSPAANDITAEGELLSAGDLSNMEVRQKNPGEVTPAPSGNGQPPVGSGDISWTEYPVHGVDNGFIAAGSVPMDKIANGYADAQAVWHALATDPNVGLVDDFTLQGGFGQSFSISGIDTDADTFDPITVSIRDTITGKNRDVKIIGFIDFGASSNFMGVFVGGQAFRDVYGAPTSSLHFLKLTSGADSDKVAKEIESTLVTTGVQADSLKTLAEKNNALSRSFLYLMQAFMGLGLVVGIAAIGVIAFRTVVERRQQIGMLRAIGYKKSTVALSFMMESSFITLLGVLSGIGLGLFLAYFLVTSSSFPAKNPTYHVPWLQIGVIGVITILASLAMTWIPARRASSVPTAEALRYE